MINPARINVGITGISAIPDNPAPGVSVINCLRQAFGNQVRIIGLGYDAFDSGFYIDNCCDVGYLLPYPRVGLEKLFFRLNEIQQIERMNFLIPCLDAELSLFSRLTEKLVDIGIKTFLPNEAQLERISKGHLSELAKIVDFDYPEVKSLYSPSFFESCNLEGWAYPIVVKGIFYDARIVHSVAAGIVAFNEISRDWGLPVLAQRFISGEEYNLTAIGDGAGNMLGEVMMKKVAVTQKNKAYVGVTMYDDILLAAAKKIIKELQWKGPFELEVIRDSNGIYHLIEINPRFPAWISLSSGVGRNLPARLLELAQGKKLSSFAPFSTGTYFIRYTQDEMVTLEQIESMAINGHSILKEDR
jgi:carbamoyl-phosphate synthase large subunit